MSVVYFKADSKGNIRDGTKTSEVRVRPSQPDVKVDTLHTTHDEIEDLTLESDPYFLTSEFESVLFATVLENVIFNCTILNACQNHLRVKKITNDVPLLLVAKYGIEKPDNVPDELDLIDPNQLGCEDCEEYQLKKLHQDREDVMRVIPETYKDLAFRRTFRPLWDFCQHATDMEEHRENLINDTLNNKTLARSLNRQLRHSRIQRTTARYEVDGVIEELSREIKEKYQKMEEAMAKYDVDTEKMDLKIQIMRTKACETTEKRQQLDELLVKRTREIKDWLKFKADRAKAREYHDSMTRSATVVQAWWRGLLVRLQLGPYRQKKNDVKKTVKPKKKNEKA